MRIHQLPVFIANQIAAGEVIERPASVVKELLENALDAGADTLSIEIGSGGLNQIKISDNGAGIVADDLKLAIAPHATSKIQQLDDLYRITSMGFRGEALASIASISRLQLLSKPAKQAHAMRLDANESGVTIVPCARNQGTTVDVQDLFFNAPVRKKFLKSERTEFQAIEAVVKRFALSEPAIAITLKHNGKATLVLPAATCDQSRLLRIKKLLGKEFMDGAVYLEREHTGIQLSGWVSRHDYQRSQRDKQWIYLNRRMIKDKLLHHAIQQAYQEVLHPGRFAACLLYISIPPDDVDVNVHPTKHEVRFQHPRLIHDVIVSSITRVLSDREPPIEMDSTADLAIAVEMTHYQQPLVSPNLAVAEIRASQLPAENHSLRWSKTESQRTGRYHGQPTDLTSWHVLNADFVVMSLDHQSYLVYLTKLQHHYYGQLLANAVTPILSRPLLVPVNYDINKKNHVLFEQYQPRLAELGIHFDFLSDTRIRVRTIPQCLPTLDLGKLLTLISDVSWLEHDALLNCIASCQSSNAHQMVGEERSALIQYWYQCAPSANFSVRLDTITCLSLFCDV